MINVTLEIKSNTKQKIIEYSKEISLLAQLKQNNMISDKEYQIIKSKLMNIYGIISDITAMTA